MCIDYRKLNTATRKDHFPLPFIDKMLERLAGKQYFCFLDGYSGYMQIYVVPTRLDMTRIRRRSPAHLELMRIGERRSVFVTPQEYSNDA